MAPNDSDAPECQDRTGGDAAGLPFKRRMIDQVWAAANKLSEDRGDGEEKLLHAALKGDTYRAAERKGLKEDVTDLPPSEGKGKLL